MEVYCFIFGFIIGSFIVFLFMREKNIRGIIRVDRISKEIEILLNSKELLDDNAKYVKLKIDHNISIRGKNTFYDEN